MTQCNGYSGYSSEGAVMLSPGEVECLACNGYGCPGGPDGECPHCGDPERGCDCACDECDGEGTLPCDGCAGCVPADDVATELRAIRDSLAPDEGDETDGDGRPVLSVRLRVLHGGSWELLTGDPSYDTDHRGAWGAGSIHREDSDSDMLALAQDLIEQAADMGADE